MCGIFGLVAGDAAGLDRNAFDRMLTRLFLQSESRGKEAAGAAFCTDGAIEVIRKALPASELLVQDEYGRFRDRALAALDASPRRPLAVVGHARLVTNGLQGIDANNQPVVKGDVVCVHNGIIVNEPQLWAGNPDLRKASDVDTEVVAAMLDREIGRGASAADAARRVFDQVYGEASLAVLFAGGDALLLLTNTGSLFVVHNPRLKATFYCSELAIAQRIVKDAGEAWVGCEVIQLHAGTAMLVDLKTAVLGTAFRVVGQTGPESGDAAKRPDESRAPRSITTSTDLTYKRWLNLRRCTRCILPETMPYIRFDEQGVCNYCRNHARHVLAGEEKLLRLLDGYRSKDGSADCLVGFSGGRDSSYGLHLLKAKYGMKPIAYTYDWGMVTDLARRNQARLCGKLGVEHIWVSADIKAKRKNVRRNVEAWFRKPELGMVPLFMAGDKQFMWHANRLMNETGLKLMVYSTNHFERTDFKTGFCGVAPASSGVRLNRMSGAAKAKLLAYYVRNYLTNPGYLNGSFSDTFTAFLSYYFVKQDFLYLFDYVRWDEQEINRTLVEEYDWELAKDTTTSWRIGDGTAPFYNYIYQTVAGFSEYETFRSNQVREGVMTREEAMHLVRVENRPRIDSIREYCGLIGVDFDIAMRVIDNVPKLY
ncbi:hypothetical protein [Ramlibacter humi]|uniref:Glutamine amidotransferase type-2 domain-containing protein n=1 Tax=Ramlibacter humi TaxID=2530451 RepID=A0A4Z0BZX5_9BURK|nr:hypothetical protein [Ramlibacter humi]TFZ03830.1 hypothetical protein EZ216_09265 [Ramlibacter humi]